MPTDEYMDEFPDDGGSHLQLNIGEQLPAEGARESTFLLFWEWLSQAGFGEPIYRLGTHLLSITLVLLVIWGMRVFYLRAQDQDIGSAEKKAVLAAVLPTATPTEIPPSLPAFIPVDFAGATGIQRRALLHTEVPAKPRTGVITYTVQTGDTVFGIADKFGLKPESILWGNTYILGDNPHLLTPGMDLNILPLDGVYHKWSAGEGLNGVSEYYGVTPDVIIDWEGNGLSRETIGDLSQPNIEPGTMLMVPGGERAFVTWSAPRISRSDPGKAKILGPGACGTIVDGAVGSETFVWPANNHFLSGYDYAPSTNHFGIDIDGETGDPIYASDNGVIVYAGWNNWGYGNVIVIDHGGGWQTLYAHLEYLGVICGQSVFQGSVIGSMGSTGNSSGSHLHFEMLNEMFGKVNPWNFLP